MDVGFRLVLALVALCVGYVSTTSVAFAQARHALLIGNQSYNAKVGPLKNPHRDIALVAQALESVGFKVIQIKDAGRRQVLSAVNAFAGQLAKEGTGAVSFFYYSGHGVSRPEDKANFLIPVDIKDTDSQDFWYDAIRFDEVLGELERSAPFAAHFIVFDACRNELRLPGRNIVKGFVSNGVELLTRIGVEELTTL